MPPKYNIHTSPVANRYPTVIRSGVIAWEEGCLKCPKCVKRQCVYGVYDKRGLECPFHVGFAGQFVQRLFPLCSKLPEPPDP